MLCASRACRLKPELEPLLCAFLYAAVRGTGERMQSRPAETASKKETTHCCTGVTARCMPRLSDPEEARLYADNDQPDYLASDEVSFKAAKPLRPGLTSTAAESRKAQQLIYRKMSCSRGMIRKRRRSAWR